MGSAGYAGHELQMLFQLLMRPLAWIEGPRTWSWSQRASASTAARSNPPWYLRSS